MNGLTVELQNVRMSDINQVGGKNASLGEMIGELSASGISVPHGFATTADFFKAHLATNQLDKKIYGLLDATDTQDIKKLAISGKQIRQWILETPFSKEFEDAIASSYTKLEAKIGSKDFSVAVRSSATAEDLPEASFAGQQETLLNVTGLKDILHAIKTVFASLFTDRAIAYREHHQFKHNDVALSVGIQQMVRSDLSASGVMFTLDTESGFDEVVFITSSYGLGECVVQGAVNPDEFYVYKPAIEHNRNAIIRRVLGSKAVKMIYDKENYVKTEMVDPCKQRVFSLTDEDIQTLAKQAIIIEKHYKKPMDIEWAKDGLTNKIYILQARPETVESRNQNSQSLERFSLKETPKQALCEGRSIGQRIGQGTVRVIRNIDELHKVNDGDILVSDMTDPDWEPVMKKSAAIITNRGGRTCHAAIIARELGIPAVVGCGDATNVLADGDEVTVSCAEGDIGYVYQGLIPFECKTIDVKSSSELPVKIMLNVGNPERAFSFRNVPNMGVGLARLEFLISNTIGIHPRALLDYEQLTDLELKEKITHKTQAYQSPIEFYIERLKEGIASIAAAFYPNPVIVRLSDFKSNEYANLLGGSLYEPQEENPMIGFRGASRYVSPEFAECFALECEAVKRARNHMGLNNIEIMIPFVRTLTEASQVIEVLSQNGLERGKDDLRIIMMCELPSNAILAEQFLEYFDGFSIGSNDLTQLTLGLDRDSGLVANQFDERDLAVKSLIKMAISACKKQGKYIGICGQGPSDHRDLAKWLIDEKIDSMSLNPDSVLETILFMKEYN